VLASFLLGCVLLAAAGLLLLRRMTVFPGQNPLPPEAPSPEEEDLAARLRGRVEALAAGIGPRHFSRPGTLEKSAAWIASELTALGHSPRVQSLDRKSVV